ncbi:MAG: DUF1501 domain-containing protein [Bacteroidia bacterium]
MQRRRFLKQLATVGAAPILLNGIPVRVMANSMATQLTCAEVTDRVLVVVQLHGGNDGLNTVVPLNHLTTYNTIRPSINLPTTGLRPLITLDSTVPVNQQVGLNHELGAFKSLYDSGKMALIQNAGYANNNRSHFKAKDDWLTGSDSQTSYASGWLGRFLDHNYPNYPTGYPNPSMPDPIGLELGASSVSLSFHKPTGGSIALAMKGDPAGYYSLVSGVGGPVPQTVPATHFGDKLQRVIDTQLSSNNYAQRIDTIFNAGSNSATVTYPLTYHSPASQRYNNELAPQLKTVARLISGGSKTKIYWVRLTGFDTHVNQTDSTDHSKGVHAVLMHHLSESIKAFQDDLAAQGLEDRVMTVTFSEFGRRAAENGSSGTDHGTFAPMFVVGKHVKAGIMGNNSDLTNLNRNDLTTLDNDYRKVFTTILQDWLGADQQSLNLMNFGAFSNQKLPLVDTPEIVPANCYLRPLPVSLLGFDAHPQSDNKVRCEWFTQVESNNKSFIVERSKDGTDFVNVADIAGGGTRTGYKAYEWLDEDPIMGVSYYRLKQVDYSGEVSFYPKVAVFLQEDHDEITTKAYPNPCDTFFNVDVQIAQAGAAMLSVVNAKGQTVMERPLSLTAGKSSHKIACDHLSQGMYIINIATSKGEHSTFRIVKR